MSCSKDNSQGRPYFLALSLYVRIIRFRVEIPGSRWYPPGVLRKHPQLRTLLSRSIPVFTIFSFPQSHKHFHLAWVSLIPAGSTTVNLPNLCPVRSGWRVSCLRHPQLEVFPLLSLEVLTRVVLPQSHWHFHSLPCPGSDSLFTKERTVKRPNLLPTKELSFHLLFSMFKI